MKNAQFTAQAFTGYLETAKIRISMDGRGHTLDNIFIERLWRILKYEDIYLKQYETVLALEGELHHYFHFYNHERPHQSWAIVSLARLTTPVKPSHRFSELNFPDSWS